MRLSALHSSSSRVIATVIVVILPILIAIIAGYMLYQERVAVGRAAGQHADNIATILQHDIDHTIATIDSALKDAADGLQLISRQPLSAEATQLVLFDSAMRQSEYGAVLVIDEHGVTLFDSRSAIPRQRNFVERDWFKTHRDNPDAGLVVGLSPQGLSNLPIVTFSRRLVRADGSFGGVVAAAMQMSLFKDMFGSLSLGPRDEVIFRTTDGRGVYRRSSGVASFGADVTASELFRLTKEAQTALVETVSVEDGVDRLFAFRRLGSLPLAVIVGLARTDIYAAWWTETWVFGTSVGILLLLSGLLAYQLRRELDRRERAEYEARENEAKFRLLADNSSDMISRVSSSGQWDYASPAALRLLGVPADSLLGKFPCDYVEADDRPIFNHAMQQLREGATSHDSAYFRIRRADSEQRWIEAVKQPILDPVTGEPGGYISAWRDVTSRKMTEVRLSESEHRYRMLANNATDVITCLDLSLRRTYVSPAAKVVFGYDPEEMMGVVPVAAIHPDDIQAASERFGRLRSGQSDQELLTNRIRHKDGHYIWVEAKLSLMRDAALNAPVAIMCAIRDISERKKHEDSLSVANIELERISRHLALARDAAEQASRAKSRFLANVSHELRTPLNGILGYTQLLQVEGGLNQIQAARVASMLSAGEHLLEMINCVLDLSEVEAGHVEQRPIPTNLAVLTAACVDLVRPAADRKGLGLVSEIARELPECVMVDSTRLRQIILNLLGNAIKFTPSGDVRLCARIEGETLLRIEIRDTGPGIAAEQQDRLFHDFDRLGDAAAQGIEGTGLGLALSRRLAIALEGSIGYTDNPTGGSVFWFEIPLQTAEMHPTSGIVTASADDSASSPNAGLRILVVDDIEINRDVAASLLRAIGHHPLCVDSGEKAIALVGSTDLDLVLMDIRMPGMDGLEATRRIRALAGPCSRVAVVALTAQVFAEDASACRAAGMDGHLTKPFTLTAFATILQKISACSAIPARSRSDTVVPGLDHAQSSSGKAVPIIDVATFQQTSQYLPVASTLSHLQTLIARTETLLTVLRPPQSGERLLTTSNDLAEMVHALGGSAGIFGFQRLAMVARQFEHDFRAETGEGDGLGEALLAATEETLLELVTQCARLQCA